MEMGSYTLIRNILFTIFLCVQYTTRRTIYQPCGIFFSPRTRILTHDMGLSIILSCTYIYNNEVCCSHLSKVYIT